MGMDDIQVTSVIGTASDGLWEADYTMSQPAGDWFAEAYDLKDWKRGKPLLERKITESFHALVYGRYLGTPYV